MVELEHNQVSTMLKGVAMQDILVVVDMQSKFEAANNINTIQNVAELIKEYKQKGDLIIFLEYETWGYREHIGTNKELLDIVSDYNNYKIILKDIDDGSIAMLYHLDRYGDYDFHLCGVNLSACVKRTAIGLKKYFVRCNVSIMIDACNEPEQWAEECPDQAGFDHIYEVCLQNEISLV